MDEASIANVTASLRDIRLPDVSTAERLADYFAAAGIAGVLVLALVGVGRGLGLLRMRRAAPGLLPQKVTAALALPEAQQRLALLALLKEHHPNRFAKLRPALYRPNETRTGGLPTAERLANEVLRD